MTAEQLLTADLSGIGEPRGEEHGRARLIRDSWAQIEPDVDELGRLFYANLFRIAPETRDLFPVNLQVQRSRLVRALVHVVQMIDRPDELTPFLEQLGRDHRKFGVVARHFEAVGEALFAALADTAGPVWTPEVREAWVHAYELVSGAMRTAVESERGPATWFGEVVAHERIGWDIAIITVQAPEPIPYRAGQYLSVEVPQRPRLWRYLSPANAPREDGTLDFHVRAVEGGWVSRAIVAHTNIGDTWRFGSPMGRMHVDPGTGREVLMVCGGTGVAPMKALLEDIAQRPEQPRTQVFVGGRTWDDLYDFTSLRKFSYSNTWLDVIPVVEE